MTTASSTTQDAAHSDRGYTTTFTVRQAPQEVYAAVLDAPTWWTGEVEGSTDRIGAEFSYRHGDQHFSRQRVVELDPGRRVVWQVVDSHLSFISEPEEWTGSEIIFDIAVVPGGTELTFTHVGLMPDVECYGACSVAWRHYVNGSLHNLITEGVALPDPF